MIHQEPFYLYRDRMQVKVKLRTEKKGDEDVNAYDIMLLGAFPNAVLIKLNPELRPLFYTQTQDDIFAGETFNTLRFPEFGPMDWKLEMGRMSITMHDEDDDYESLTLTSKDADKFHFELMPGGTVKLGLRIKVGEVEDEAVLLKLLRASHQALLISLSQAEIEEVPDNFEQVEQMSATGAPPSAARQAAEDLFKGGPESLGDTFDKLIGAEGAQEEEQPVE